VKDAKEPEMNCQIHMRRLLKLAGPVLALHYRRAAQRDESHGFSIAAAMEWRRAAELSSWITPLANRYWREWERIMHLSRRLAMPLGIANAVPIAVPQQSSPSRVDLAVQRTRPQQVILQTAT
jgi:hypothetical protein